MKTEFQGLIEEDRLVARSSLQVAVDMAGIDVLSMAMVIVMRQDSWLHSSWYPREMKATVKGTT